jgi:DNA-binding SARP family transcriptional activator
MAPMPTLSISLLGPPQIKLDDAPLVLHPRNSARARAILLYIAATGRPEARERLAGLLWSDAPEKKAREYLRGELFLLAPLKGEFWLEHDGRLALRPETCAVDLVRFRQFVETSSPAPEALDAALQLWRGHFLEGFESAVESSAALYVEWLQETRIQMEGLFRKTLYQLADACGRTQRRYELGLDACARLLALEPEREEVHRLKMRLLALDGQRVAALRQYDECTAALLDELGVPPSNETNALYDQIVSGELGAMRSLDMQAAPTAPPFQAPAAPGHFAGRTAEIEQLVQWLTSSGRGAVVSIVGMGGVGKTALAAIVAECLRPHFAGGVLWARVANGDPLDILQSWALAYDKDLSKIGTLDARAAAMRSILADRHALIVLDDLVAGRAVESLLPGAAACPVLITTRDRTEVSAYTTQILDLEELAPADGLAMLTGYLGAGQVEAEQDAALDLCATLGGLPLAMEIAAQRIFASPRPSVTRMVRSLQDAGTRLAQGVSNRSVRTSFAVSWEALPADLRTLFALTGLFEGRSFTSPAIAAAARLEDDTSVDALDQLVTLSMLKTEGNVRYVHHRLLADFAAEKLALHPDGAGMRLRLAAYYATLAREASVDYDRLEAEWENLTAAIAAAHSAGAWQLVLDCVDALAAPWFARARFAHARRGFAWGIDAAETLGDESRCARYAYYLGKVLLRQDDYPAARQHLDRAIGVFRAVADRPRLADAYVDLADVATEEGKYAEASSSLVQALALYGELRQPVGLATVKSRQALLAVHTGDWAEARRLCQEGLAQLPEGDGALVRSRTLRLLSDLALYEAQLQEAADYCRQAEAVNQQINDPTEAAAILYAQAKLDHYLGFQTEALSGARRSAERYAAMGDRKAAAIVHHFLSRVHVALDDAPAARAAADYGIDVAHALGDTWLLELCSEQRAAVDAYSERLKAGSLGVT